MMLVLKLPIVYLGVVCWWAIRAEPRPLEPALLPVLPEQRPWTPQSRHPRRPRQGPHGGPERRFARSPRVRSAERQL
jgi:hypothetical protein